MLLVGRDAGDPLFLHLNEAEASVLEPYRGGSVRAHHGRRVVEGQRLMQAASDILLVWIRATDVDGNERDFYVGQLWDREGWAPVERMNPKTMLLSAEMCGQTLAKAHARSGDAVAIASYLARATASTARWPRSPSATRIRTSATTAPSRPAVASSRLAVETSVDIASSLSARIRSTASCRATNGGRSRRAGAQQLRGNICGNIQIVHCVRSVQISGRSGCSGRIGRI
jgi:hypothetical protein